MTIFNPFNQDPFSSVVKTGSYTIPVGYYAKVTPTEFQDDFEIDSVVAVPSKYIIVNVRSSSSSGLVPAFTVPTGLSCKVGIHGIGSSLVLNAAYSGFAADLEILTVGTYYERILGAAGAINYSTGTNLHSISIMGEYFGAAYNQEFWVPTETDLDGTRYIVELYPIQ